MLTLLETFKLLKGIPLAKTISLRSNSDLNSIQFPYYIKVSMSGHKTEQNAVIKCNNLQESEHHFKRLSKQFPKQEIVIQEEISGANMVLGIKQDITFGKLLLIGFGGTNIEILKDIIFLSNPTKTEIKKALESLKLYPTLYKREKYSIEKFIDLAYNVSKLNFTELDLNPVILTEKKVFVVDARGSI